MSNVPMPRWFAEAMYAVLLNEAARKVSPPCRHCGETTNPVAGDHLRRRCPKCKKVFSLVKAGKDATLAVGSTIELMWDLRFQYDARFPVLASFTAERRDGDGE